MEGGPTHSTRRPGKVHRSRPKRDGAEIVGTLDLGRARVLVYAFSTAANVIESAREQGELAERIARLEQALAVTKAASAPWRPVPPPPPTA